MGSNLNSSFGLIISISYFYCRDYALGGFFISRNSKLSIDSSLGHYKVYLPVFGSEEGYWDFADLGSNISDLGYSKGYPLFGYGSENLMSSIASLALEDSERLEGDF